MRRVLAGDAAPSVLTVQGHTALTVMAKVKLVRVQRGEQASPAFIFPLVKLLKRTEDL